MNSIESRISRCVDLYSQPAHWVTTKNDVHLLIDGEGKVEKPDPTMAGSSKPAWFKGGSKTEVASPGNSHPRLKKAMENHDQIVNHEQQKPSRSQSFQNAFGDQPMPGGAQQSQIESKQESKKPVVKKVHELTPEEMDRVERSFKKQIAAIGAIPATPELLKNQQKMLDAIGKISSRRAEMSKPQQPQSATAPKSKLKVNLGQAAYDNHVSIKDRREAMESQRKLSEQAAANAKPPGNRKGSSGYTPGIQNIVDTRKAIKSGKDESGNPIDPKNLDKMKRHLMQSVFAAKGLSMGEHASISNLDRKVREGVGYYSKLKDAVDQYRKTKVLPNQRSLFDEDDTPESPHGPIVVTKKITTTTRTKKHSIKSKTKPGIHWITIHGHGGKGTHIQVKDDGTIVNAPGFLKSQGITKLSDFGKVKEAAVKAKELEAIDTVEEDENEIPFQGPVEESHDDDEELLESNSGEDQDSFKSRMDRIVEEEFGAVPSAEDQGSGVGSGELPESDGELSSGTDGDESGFRDGSTDSERSGDERIDSERTTGRGEHVDGMGGRGSGSGHNSGDGKAIAESLAEPATAENPTDIAAGNWKYQTRDFANGGLQRKFQANLEAIRTMREIAEEGRDTATPEEQEKISKFVGWGQFPGLFNEYWTNDLADVMTRDEYYENKDKWAEQRKLMKPLMTDEEWDAARKATLNSHFTHPDVIDAHWKMAQKLGFKGGRFLEPSAGIGYYLGQMPADLAGKTRSSAVELDPTTGNMLKKLYPQANVEVKGFEKHLVPKNFYDLVASNVPFGDYKVFDPEYNKHQANIHDYFFLKSADLTKPGGLVMHVTSTGTMDKKDDKIRKELAKTCDFVAAVRFPGGTHQANAGTQVVTDMIILRKRNLGELPVSMDSTPKEAEAKEPGFTGTTTDSLGRLYHWVDGKRVPGPDWFSTKQVPDPAGGDPIEVNAYFADHPEQILGTLDRTGSMYRGDSVNVSQTDDYDEMLASAIDRLPEGVFTSGKSAKSEVEQFITSEDVKDGGYVVRDGRLFKREGNSEVLQKADASKLERIAGQLEIRDAKQKVIDAESSDQNADEQRAELNKLYDSYVKKFGPLSNKDNRNAMKGDPDSPNLLALEKWDPTTKKASKADMFSKETIRPRKTTDHADNVLEAVGISLNETGGIDVDHISKLTGKTADEVHQELRVE